MEEKQRQNSPIVKEYKKFYIYLNEYEERNLNLLNVNGQLISEKRKLVDSWKESFQEKWVDFNVTNKEISNRTYLKIRNKNIKIETPQNTWDICDNGRYCNIYIYIYIYIYNIYRGITLFCLTYKTLSSIISTKLIYYAKKLLYRTWIHNE